ncbi:MAG TPA: hypothetical protein VJQ83_05715, partial [Tepidiformaceae bacterium]|nr:hypothetical protein [Tepidiformaceae bacterium]
MSNRSMSRRPPMRDGAPPLMAEFQSALRDAIDWGYDRPSAKAVDLTARLLSEFALHPRAAEGVEMAVAVDGAIEFTAVRGDEMYIVVIPPAGGGIEMAVKNWRSREL